MKFAKYIKSLRKRLRSLRCSLLGGKRILVLGDSHSGVFEYIFDQDLWSPNYINCDIVRSATACGLQNDHSVTRAFPRFLRALERFRNFDYVVIVLGEVDCSFALWRYAMRANTPAYKQIPRATQGIARLIDAVRSHSEGSTIILAGAILPTIKDDQIDLQEFELRKTVRASQLERTTLTLQYNEALQRLAKEEGIAYVDITEQTLDPVSGVVADQFLVKDKVDHHQSQEATCGLWVRALSSAIASTATRKRRGEK